MTERNVEAREDGEPWRAAKRPDAFAGVRDALVAALGVEPDDVVPEARLVADLGAESIDLVDVVFRLEKTFGIRIRDGSIFPRWIVKDPGFIREGRLTDEGFARLKREHPFIDVPDGGVEVAALSDLYTVGMLVRFVEAAAAAAKGA